MITNKQKATSSASLTEKVRSIFFQKRGPLTQELVQQPSQFGLGLHPKKVQPDSMTSSVCGFCSTGCNLDIHLKNKQAINITPSKSYPVNQGQACPKGWRALDPLHSHDRATTPLKRVKGELVPIEWDEALTTFTQRFKQIQNEYGKESVAFISTGQIPTEEMALLGALTKFGMGFIHGDGNTRQCMATAVVAYKQSFGFDAPPYSYQDFEESDVIVFMGANPCIAHPIMWERVGYNKNNPKIIVVDPRCTETATQATHHFQLKPKSDLTLYYGIAHVLNREQWIDSNFVDQNTEGYKEFVKFLAPFTPEYVSEYTGLTTDEIEQFATLIHQGKNVSFWWTMGINQGHEAVRTAQAIINLALMTGNIGRLGTGANSITGQTNAMGSRLFSNTTSLLGHRDFTNKKHREEVATILKIPENIIPQQNSLAYNEIIEQIDKGKIKGLWIIATNPSHSWIHQSRFKETLNKLDFLVVQDMYHNTETCQQAHLILPAAGWGEKEGTIINSERRIGLYQKVSKAPGKALADFYIFKMIAHYWGCSPLFEEWKSPETVFQLLKKLSKKTPCDFSGISNYQMIKNAGGIQWPYTEEDNESDTSKGTLPLRHRHLFSDGKFYHPNKKARFIFEKPREIYEPLSQAYPLVLLTGRGSSAQWHTLSRTGKSALLNKLAPQQVYIEIHPKDAKIRRIQPGEEINIHSARGQLKAIANITPTVGEGQVFLPMHYKDVNQLTYPSFDPYSKQPSYKFSAVQVYR